MKHIQLSQGQTAIVCDCHYHLVENYKWRALWSKGKRQFYATRTANLKERLTGVPRLVYMHRVVNDTPSGYDTDHINNNSLDNQCKNLRIATHSENLRNRNRSASNTSGYKGVSWHKARNKWRAVTEINGKHIHIGLFDTPEAAARAYDRFAQETYGEFATLNFPK